MGRPPRLNIESFFYHLYARGNNGQEIFSDLKDRERFLKKLKEYKQKLDFKLHAYVLMTSHFHLLLQQGKVGVSQIMQRLMTAYTMYFNKRHNHKGHVFESRFQSIIIEKENYLLQVNRYIHLNPVNAGLVNSPAEYPWSSYRVYLGQVDDGGLTEVEETLNLVSQNRNISQQKFKEFVEGEKERGWDPLKEHSRGILGSGKFRGYLARRLGMRI